MLIAAVVVVISVLGVLSYGLFNSLTNTVETGQFELMQSIVDDALRGAENKALARAELVADLPATKRLMAARDRPGLLAEFGEMFAKQKARHGVDQAQFHVPPATSFLRLNDPSKFGDDLTRFRPIVVAVNRERASRKGFAIARSGPAIFGVAPISDPSGNALGSFEIGIDFAPLLVALKSAHGLDLALFVEGASLREFAAGIDPAKLGDQNQVGRFIRFTATNATLMQGLVGAADIAAVNAPTHYTREDQGNFYGVLLIPLKNGSGESLGVIAAARNFNGTRAAAGQSLVWQICFSIIAIVILSGMIVIVIRGFLLQPLKVINTRFAALSAGQPAEPIEDPGAYPAEMSQILALYERIRSRKSRPGTTP
ncbi:cache domain-containing protein [Aquabacter sp. CN5-332]|uniref:cache domain-containing protein n=1 Tax=Aquabacter sp. CN5-332 TaxID=3156608 RepID=UPI0032B60062